MDLAKDIIGWINHVSNGKARSKNELAYYNKLWDDLRREIKRIEGCEAPMDYEEDFAAMAQYSGKLFRLHQVFDSEYPFGVQDTGSFVSWTTHENVEKLPWLRKRKDYLLIEAYSVYPDFAVDLTGIEKWANKYDFPLSLDGRGIQKEVVFPLSFDRITEMNIWRLD